jgi:NAD(P)H-flavin reductase
MTEGASDPLVPALFGVQQTRRETDDTFSIEVRPAGGGEVPAFAAGQFNMLYVFGVGEVPISISGDPARKGVLVHTTRAVGAVTRAMRALKKGDALGVRGPFGVGWPIDACEGHDVVIVAGGIGLAPLRPAIYRLLARRDRYGKLVLLYGTRTSNDLLFRRELETWRARLDFEVYVTVDRGTGAQVIADGRAFAKFRDFVAAQGGDVQLVEHPERLPAAPVQVPAPAPVDGYVHAIDARTVGLVTVDLGGGRLKKGDPVDPAVGVLLRAKVARR